jgi:hypothetical protein
MSRTPRIVQLAIAVLAGALLAGGGYAIAASNSTKTINGCVVKKSHQLLIEKGLSCRFGGDSSVREVDLDAGAA